MSSWLVIQGDLASTSIKQRLHGLESLLAVAESDEPLSLTEFAQFVEQCGTLLKDSSFKVAQQTLHVLSKLVEADPNAIKPYANSIVPLVAERLADARQPVRQEACKVLLELLAALKPENVIPRLARFWTHGAWKVRHGMLQTLAEAVAHGIPGMLNHKEQNNYLITQVVNLVEDPNETVRDAALDCLQELYKALGTVLLDNLRRQSIRPAALREVVARLDQVAPCNIHVPTDGGASPGAAVRPGSHAGGAADVDGTVKVDVVAPAGHNKAAAPSKRLASKDAVADAPVVLSSERELAAELEAMVPLISSLLPDWQQRIGALARLEGIAKGSPHLSEALVELLKPMRDHLAKQVEDRRSAVNKQACQTLTVLSSVLGSRFQDHAIYFLPLLFKVLPITVQIMAESADQCCHAILRSCQSHRLLPLLLQAATKDKNARIRALCCSYMAMVVETWDTQVCLRCADELEAAMKSAAQDASAEARQAARRTFAAYAAKCPDQASALLQRLEPSIRDKLCKGCNMGGVSSSSSAAGDQRPGAGAGPAAVAQRPRLARKPLPGFAGSKAAAADVLVYVAERPASAPYVDSENTAASMDSMPAAARPWSAQQHAVSQANVVDPPATSKSGAGSAQVMNCPAPATTSMTAPTGRSRPSLSGAAAGVHGLVMPPPGPPPRAPTGGGTTMGLPSGLSSSYSVGVSSGSERATSSGGGGMLSQRGPYRSSAAADLPPMERLPQSAGGRKSLGFAGPSRVPGPVASGLYPSDAATTSAALAHALLSNSAAPETSADLVTVSAAAAAAPPRSKASRRSTGGIGLMAAGLGTLHQQPQQAVRVPSLEAPSAATLMPPPAAPLEYGGAVVSGAASIGGGSYAALAAATHGSPAHARRITVSGHAVEAAVAASAQDSSLAALGPPALASSRSTGSWGMGSNGSGSQAPVWGLSSISHSSGISGPLQVPAWPPLQTAAAPLSTKQSISKVVSGLLSGPKSWSEKVAALATLAGLLEQVAADSGRDQGSDCGRDLERLGPKLLEFVEDSHHKVAAGALEVLRAALRAQPRALDGAVERLLPAVFLRTADAKDSIRGLAASALADCSASFPADILLVGLARSLEACKLPRTRITVLEYTCQHIGHGRPAGAPSSATLTKQWLRQLCVLLADKNLDVRRAAVEAVEALYLSVDPGLVVQYVSFATGPEALALKRVLTGLSERLGSAGVGPTAMDVDGVPLGLVGTHAASADSETQQQQAIRCASPISGVKAGGGYIPQDYMSPMRVDVERIADVGMPLQLGSEQTQAAAVAPLDMGAGIPGSRAGSTGYVAASLGTRMPAPAAPPAHSMDVQAASRHVSLLVYRLQMATSPEQEEDAWQRLTECVEAGQAPAVAWEGSAAQVRLSLGRALRSGTLPVRRTAVALLTAMAKSQPALLQRALLGTAVPALLAMVAGLAANAADNAQGYKEKEAAKAAFDALGSVLEAAPAPAAIELLTSQLPSEDADTSPDSRPASNIMGGISHVPGAQLKVPAGQAGRVMEDMDPELLAAVMRCLHMALRRLDLAAGAARSSGATMTQQEAEALREHLLGLVVPGVRCALGHARADIRKAAVFCLVELWCKLGDILLPYMAPLSDAQRKLIDIYYRRACGAT